MEVRVWTEEGVSGRLSYSRPLAVPLCALSQSVLVFTELGGAHVRSICGAGEYDLCPLPRGGVKGIYGPRDLWLRDGVGEVVAGADES